MVKDKTSEDSVMDEIPSQYYCFNILVQKYKNIGNSELNREGCVFVIAVVTRNENKLQETTKILYQLGKINGTC